jgi:hypothetical protein
MAERRYRGECECPQCGCGSKGLKPEALPLIMHSFGLSHWLKCDICKHEWILREPT